MDDKNEIRTGRESFTPGGDNERNVCRLDAERAPVVASAR